LGIRFASQDGRARHVNANPRQTWRANSYTTSHGSGTYEIEVGVFMEFLNVFISVYFRIEALAGYGNWPRSSIR